MKRFSQYSYLFLLSFVLILNGCTGTPAPATPLYVIAGITDNDPATDSANSSSVLVLQDRISDELPTDAPRFERFASQPLAAQARVFETVEEASSRDELVVLSRTLDVTTSARTVKTYLDFFNIRGLTPTDDTTFRPSRNRVDLKTLTYPVTNPVSVRVETLCPIDMEINRTGSHAVIYSSPSVCFPNTATDNDAMIVIELPQALPSTTPAIVRSVIPSVFPNRLVRSNVSANDTARAAMYIDQSGDTLYYLRERGTQSVTFQSLSFTAYTSDTPETDTNTAQIIVQDAPFRSENFRDMIRVGSNIVLLSIGDYLLLPQTPPSTTFSGRPTDTVDARSVDSRAFVQDATSSRLFILDDNERLIYHAEPATTTNTVIDIEGTTSAYNMVSSFLYIAGTDTISRVDTLPLGEGSTELDFVEETCDTSNTAVDSLCTLDNPTALSWAEGILLASPQ